ncbi:MAG: hypothetical protein WCT04_27625 [Planctomycetota bacterium]
MQPTSRDGKSEMKRAELIFKFELPQLLPIPSVGHATVVNIQFESGLRGLGLDYRNQLWTNLQQGSSSCNLDHACVTADSLHAQVKFKLPIGLFGGWDSQTQEPGWPHRACVRINAENESVCYFDLSIDLPPQQYQILSFYAQWSQSHRGPASNVKLLRSVDMADGADLPPVISRIRRAFREVALKLEDEAVRDAAVALVDELLPNKKPGIGYSLGRSELFQIF